MSEELSPEDAFSSELVEHVEELVHASARLPAADSYRFQADTSSEFRAAMRGFGTRLLSLLQCFIDDERRHETATAAKVRTFTASSLLLPELDDAADVLDHFGLVSDVADALHERVASFLDDTDARRAAAAAAVRVDRTLRRHEKRAARVVRASAPATSAASAAAAAAAAASASASAGDVDGTVAVFPPDPDDAPGMRHQFGTGATFDDAVRPQLAFADTVDNSTRPWLPRGPHEAHQRALAALRAELLDDSAALAAGAGSAADDADNNDDSDGGGGGDGGTGNGEPAARLVADGDDEELVATGVWAVSEPVQPGDLETTPCEWVDTIVALRALARVLDQQSAFAVDLEHHEYRSFLGFTCLMQVSTRQRDYLIDTLALREHMHALNSSFMNAAIVKVLHGADSDVQWMARDFGLYLVNLFDTCQAARVLQLERASLAHVMEHYCGVSLDKRYQMADWRVRPLSRELRLYARLDTHSLLYVFDVMRNALVERRLLRFVRQRSLAVSATRYAKPLFHAEQGDALMRTRTRSQARPLTDSQRRVLECVLVWRESVARQRDESVMFVLSNADAEHLARREPLDRLAVLAFETRRHSLLREHADDVARLVRDARDADSRDDAVARLCEHLAPLYQPVAVKLVTDPVTNRTRFVAADDAAALGRAAIDAPSVPQLSLHTLVDADADVPLPRARLPVHAARGAGWQLGAPNRPDAASAALVAAVRQSFDSSLLAAYRAIAAKGAAALRERARAQMHAAVAEQVAAAPPADVLERVTELERATVDRKTGQLHLPKSVAEVFGDTLHAQSKRRDKKRVRAEDIVVQNRAIAPVSSASHQIAVAKSIAFQRPLIADEMIAEAAFEDLDDDGRGRSATDTTAASATASAAVEVVNDDDNDDLLAILRGGGSLPAFAQPVAVKKRPVAESGNAKKKLRTVDDAVGLGGAATANKKGTKKEKVKK
jgi:exosome complex exonuclease RRP6